MPQDQNFCSRCYSGQDWTDADFKALVQRGEWLFSSRGLFERNLFALHDQKHLALAAVKFKTICMMSIPEPERFFDRVTRTLHLGGTDPIDTGYNSGWS